MYRGNYQKQNSRSGNILSTNTNNSVNPSVKRQYLSQATARKRYTSNDLNDNDSDGSLWADGNNSNFLFSVDSTKSNGDIILINVLSNLKNEITSELKRNFPDVVTRKGKKTAGAKEATPPAKNQGATVATGGAGTIYDRISSIIIEEINKEHLLIKGRKGVLFKNKKRLVEIQALISRRDVDDSDTIESDKILESNITILR